MKKLLFFAFLFLAISSMSSQSLSEYQWENRLVIIFTETKNSKDLREQLKELEGDIKGLEDRKVVILHALPKKQKKLLPEESDFQDSELYKKKESKTDFEVILIGLDGGVKLRQNDILKTEKLYGLIDSMPMRQAEMRRNKN